ncbi:hypothetical protein RCL_jg9882.t1 [Rhizophagus clarus]|uniref:Uncharacterized protein n=1 Tax=Rhizophagus clarus TaxID=94130 RepID=A0A8H3M2S9_9GLOM|nr:hypothetical protein RCL_jg9882.t1 [Rhizophagus clarus]
MTSTQETCTYKIYDEHKPAHNTSIAEWKKASQQGFFTKTPELLPTIQQAKQKKLNEELTTLLIHHLTSFLAYLRSWYPEQPETPILGATSPPLHDAIKKVEESSAPLLDSNAGKEKRLKVQDAEAAQVITGYQASSGCQFVQDILIYDVSAKWDNYELLSYLST